MPEGNSIRMEWFKTFDETPARSWFTKVVQSWDTGMSAAPTSDFSVCTTWGFRDDRWYLLDVFRERLDFPDLRDAVIRLWRSWKPDRVLIERAASGIPLMQEIRVRGLFIPFACKVHVGKETRFTGCFGEIEAGHILLPTKAPWLEIFQQELRAFPLGKHDDQVDSMSQFINHQKIHWRWVVTEYGASGRPIRQQHRHRPWDGSTTSRLDPPRPR